MDENNRKNELIKAMADVEFFPVILNKENFNLEKHVKMPLEKVTALGVAFEPITSAFQKIFLGNSGGSGLYMVNVPPGGYLASLNDGSGFIGGVLNNGTNQVMAQARLNPLLFNPTMLFMAVALMNIEKKLDNILEIQKEIIEFLEQKEKTKLRGNLIFLTDVHNNYKYNWTNETYRNNNHIKVLDIKQESEQSILFYQEQINRKVKKKTFFHSNQDVKEKLKTINSEFFEYQLALYLHSFSSFLDVMLLENFESAYMEYIAKKIEDYVFQYDALYNACYSQIEGYSKSSIQSRILSGIATINRAAGDTVAKIPIVSNTQIDETLIKASNKIGKYSSKKTEQIMEKFMSNQNNGALQFIESIKTVNRLYNQPMELIFDEENIYLELSE